MGEDEDPAAALPGFGNDAHNGPAASQVNLGDDVCEGEPAPGFEDAGRLAEHSLLDIIS